MRYMPTEDFQPFVWQPTDPYWTDVRYVQQQRTPVTSLIRADRPTRGRSGPVTIKRHANVCQRCQLQSVRNGRCLDCETVQRY
jgi:hypothetical protein